MPQFNMDAEIFWSIFSGYADTTQNNMGWTDPVCGGDQGLFLLSVRRGELLFEGIVSRHRAAAADVVRLDTVQYRRHALPVCDHAADLPAGAAGPRACPGGSRKGLVRAVPAQGRIRVAVGLRAVQRAMGIELRPVGHSRSAAAAGQALFDGRAAPADIVARRAAEYP